jgi:type I restriction enzyme S subunit
MYALSKIVDKLFSPFETKNSIRFSEFSEDWQFYSYDQILEVSNERNTDNSVTHILSASQVHGMIERDKIDIDIKFDKSSTKTYKIVHPGDYVVHLRSFQGGFAFAKQKGICSPAYTILRPKPMLEFSFLTEYFASEKFIQQLKMVTYGIRDGRSINVEDFLKLHIFLPSRQEQKKLKSVIAVLNDKLFQSDALLSLLQSQKKYLLRHLFI